jgi:L-threonylcarbamoyladenylate synthase
MDNRAAKFIDALDVFPLLVHPTDTVPGLTFHPERKESVDCLFAFKGRSTDKSFIGLTASYEKALLYFAPLPELWVRALPRLWPGPLSIIWKAAASCPQILMAQDHTVALRVPRLKSEDAWLYEVLQHISFPLPTTSVNFSGEAPKRTWQEAVQLVAHDQNIFVPEKSSSLDTKEGKNDLASGQGRPSTLIKINDDGSYALLREGLVSRQQLDEMLRLTLNEKSEEER